MDSNSELIMNNLTALQSSYLNNDEGLEIPFSSDRFSDENLNFPTTVDQEKFTYNNDYSIPAALSLISADLDNWTHESNAGGRASIEDPSLPSLSRGPKNMGGRKRKRSEGRDGGKTTTREVIHVRAKRGQATDSHSLAERVRREKINQRLKCLRDLVPGCYKTMGMPVMLGVIINYVQSLQNQIEFLSMKLSVASRYYDFNCSSEPDPAETTKGTDAHEVQEMERMVREEGYGGNLFFPPTCPL